MNEVIEIESTPTKIKYKGIIWVPEQKESQRNIKELPKETKIKTNNINNNFTTPVEKRGNIKKPYIIKWIEQLEVGDVFTLDQFYYKYPKIRKDHVGCKRVDKIIVNLVQEGKINHWKREGEFRVLK